MTSGTHWGVCSRVLSGRDESAPPNLRPWCSAGNRWIAPSKWGQAAKMIFLCRVAVLSLRDRVRSSDSRRELGVEPLLLRIERSQLRWFGHLIRMSPGRLPLEVFQTRPTGRRPQGRPRTRWRDYISRIACERLGIPQNALGNVAGERGVWVNLLGLLPPRPDPRISG